MVKRLSNYILDLGRVVAYYPNLKKVTQSTTATILLCQLLYWTDITKNDGWIYKTSEDIEEETGLTHCEVKTAKEKLIELKLIDCEFKRLDHTSRYRVNQEELNSQWETMLSEEEKQKKKAEEEKAKKEKLAKQEQLEKERKEKEQKPAPKFKVDTYVADEIPGINESTIKIANDSPASAHTSAATKKGDYLDAMLEFSNSPAGKLEARMKEVKEKIETQLAIRASNDKWLKFIKFAATMEIKNNESIDKFLAWAIGKGFDPVYWTPEKMETLWPQAFVGNETKPTSDFCPPLPKTEEKRYVSIPRYTPKTD